MSQQTFDRMQQVVGPLVRRVHSDHLLVGVSILVAMFPFIASLAGLSDYYLGVMIDFMILSMLAMGYNFLFGHTGLLSFGHALFYGFGAYMFAFLLTGMWIAPQIQIFTVAVLLTVVGTVIVGIVIGYLCVQRGNIYFAMLTLAFNMMVYHMVVQFNDITQGSSGIILPVPEVNLGIITLDLMDEWTFYYVTFVLLLVSVGILWRITNSPYGELLATIRENSQRANFMGINVNRYQWSAFVVSTVFAGMAGVLAGIRNFVVSPEMLFWEMSAEPVLAAVIGGTGTFLGPIVGAVVFIGLEETLSIVTANWHFGLGVLLMAVVLFFPKGILGTYYARKEEIPEDTDDEIE